MNTEQKAFKHLKQQDKYHLEWEAQRLSGEAERGELSRGQHTYRRRLKQVLHQKQEQSRMNLEKQVHRDEERTTMPLQAKYDEGYARGQRAFMHCALLATAIVQCNTIADRMERNGFMDGFYGVPKREVR